MTIRELNSRVARVEAEVERRTVETLVRDNREMFPGDLYKWGCALPLKDVRSFIATGGNPRAAKDSVTHEITPYAKARIDSVLGYSPTRSGKAGFGAPVDGVRVLNAVRPAELRAQRSASTNGKRTSSGSKPGFGPVDPSTGRRYLNAVPPTEIRARRARELSPAAVLALVG